jgi:membrane-bound lytic murein transglycosylase B
VRRLIALCLLASGAAQAQDMPYGKRPEVRAFVRDMAQRHGFVERELRQLFSRARRDPAVLRAIEAPRDPRARSWQAYRARFVNEARVAEGVEFWRREARALGRAAEEHGVPAEIVVAIIGVETVYGRQMGTFRVIDALATLAFDYPPRARFFRSELEQYLLYVRDAELDAFSVRGSYAGAIGIPQFMPGSYRRFAVDYDGDGTPDLRASPADAIGSVANFLARHGWRRGEPIEVPASVTGESWRRLLEAGIEPMLTLAEARRLGVETPAKLAAETPVALIDLATPGGGTEFRLGLRNFYVLTRYNRSAFYGAAVADLAALVRTARDRDSNQEGGR